MSNAVYRFRPDKRGGRLHRRGDRVRAWRHAAERWKREAEVWRRRSERNEEVARFMTELSRGGLRKSAKVFCWGVFFGALVIGFVK